MCWGGGWVILLLWGRWVILVICKLHIPFTLLIWHAWIAAKCNNVCVSSFMFKFTSSEHGSRWWQMRVGVSSLLQAKRMPGPRTQMVYSALTYRLFYYFKHTLSEHGKSKSSATKQSSFTTRLLLYKPSISFTSAFTSTTIQLQFPVKSVPQETAGDARNTRTAFEFSAMLESHLHTHPLTDFKEKVNKCVCWNFNIGLRRCIFVST